MNTRRLFQSVLCISLAPPLLAQQIPGRAEIQNRQDRTSAPTAKQSVVPPKQLEIVLIQLEDVSSATATQGQAVSMAVWKDVTVDGIVAIPKGTPAKYLVKRVTRPIPGKRDGGVQIKPVSLTLPDNSQIPLRDYDPNPNDGLCYSRVSCGIVDVIAVPFLIGELIAEPFHKKHETGKNETLPACSIELSQTSKQILIHPAGIGSVQTSPGLTELDSKCPGKKKTFMSGQ
jgi:LysM repeat protein